MTTPHWPKRPLAGRSARRTPAPVAGRAARRATVLVALAAMLVALAPPGGAQAQVGQRALAPYVVIMEAAPTGGAVATLAGQPARQPAAKLAQAQDRALAATGAPGSAKLATYTAALNGFSAALTTGQAAELARQPGVARVVRDQLRPLDTDTSPTFLGLNAKRGAWASGFTGEGVILGVIDTGIWPEHPSFADDGTYPAPPADWMGGQIACDFGDTDHNPEDFPFDCQNKLIGARDMRTLYKQFVGPELYNSARDYNGHGTHTASTAGGNRNVAAEVFGVPRGEVSGIAPRAHVAMYSACGDQGCFTGDLAAAIDAAVADGVDVINYSIGGGPGIVQADDLAFLSARAAGVSVATSNGNDGPGAGTVGSPANDPWLTGVGASTHGRTIIGSVALGDGQTFEGPTITNGTEDVPLVDAAAHGNALCDPEVTFDPPITGSLVICTRGEFVLIDKSRAVLDQGGAGMVLTDVNDTSAQPVVDYWVPSVHLNFTEGEAVKAYAAAAGDGAVAAIAAGEAREAPSSVMAGFSSRGPSTAAPDIIKPDVTAPGVDVLAGYSPTPLSSPAGNLFQFVSGTSMASPHVAGVLALLKQAHPDWSPAMAQSAVMTTARNDVLKEDGATAADPFDMGAGHLQPGERVDRPNSVFNPGLVYHAGFNEYLGFLCEAGPAAFADPEATCAALADAGIPTTAENLNYPSIGVAEVPGRVEIQRTVTSVADRTVRWAAAVDEPAGFDVDVNPRRLTLQPGESATVTLTIVNQDVPLGEWRFGELTWRGQGYRVASPIAVRPVAIGTPAEVSGTGTAGSLDFDVQFGYDGDYGAAAHGLAPRVDTADTVAQDPDQTFDPEDPTGTNAHEFTLTDAAHLRFSLTNADLSPPEQNVDLDVYLYNSAGEEVATSTAGQTNEHIDVTLPADDTYTLYVHGWQTLDGSVDYTLRSWTVPLAAGSLAIDSAPAEAVLATSGTVSLSWSGLDAGTEYLGVVSHTGGSADRLGFTMVSVSTG